MTINPRPTVVALYAVPASEVKYAQRFFDFIPFDDPRIENWPLIAEGVMVRAEDITPEDVDKCGPQLKFVAKHGVGVDQIAVKELNNKGVTVMNSAGVNACAVAELALALTMSLARNIAAIDRRVRSGMTVDKSVEGRTGIQLYGKSFGIVGGGNIGFQLARMLRGAFDATIYLFDPVISPEQLQKWSRLIPSSHFQRLGKVDEMLPLVDVLSLHVPLVDGTRNLIGETQLKLMRPGSILINTARGGVVDEKALLKALDEEWIAAAGIDAFAIEPPTVDNYRDLIKHERVLSLPHIGAASLDVISVTARAVIDHLNEALSGQEPRDVVIA